MLSWDDVREAFEPDGMLRDIYVQKADGDVWERAFTYLAKQGTSDYTVDEVKKALPRSAKDALGLRPDKSPLLLVNRDGIEYGCHFFSEEEIELDFWPEEIDGPLRLASLSDFISGLGHATGKDVVVTHENCPEIPILCYVASLGEIVLCGEGAR
jgi:hypothetical protein